MELTARRRRKAGFTLIEVLLVLVILVILVSLGVGAYTNAQINAKSMRPKPKWV
jgi:prepilin-type N-terminal cleavage/methylation domain-containing protein